MDAFPHPTSPPFPPPPPLKTRCSVAQFWPEPQKLRPLLSGGTIGMVTAAAAAGTGERWYGGNCCCLVCCWAANGADQVVVNWRHIVCHIDGRYGQEKLLPDNSMSRISVSMGVFPTRRTKKSCSITYSKKIQSLQCKKKGKSLKIHLNIRLSIHFSSLSIFCKCSMETSFRK